MKKTLFFLLVVSLINNVHGQPQQIVLSANDEYVKNLGALETFNVATIADTITHKFADKKDKARAIFYWVSNNISLDAKAIKSNDNKKVDPVIVVQTRRATPLGFANLIQEMCSMANIRCLVVDGYVKNYAEEIDNKAEEINHSWNVVQLGQSPDKWFYIDAAKASGYLDKKMAVFTKLFTSEYFFADKTLFNLDHYPDNSAWFLGGEQKSISQFYSLPVIGNTAYAYGLQKPVPITGMIKTKTTNTISFSFNYNPSMAISTISLVMGEGNKQSKPEPMNFTDNGGSVKFNYKFKKADTFTVKILVDGKELLQYIVEVEE
ncbi:MAG: hypothetical protein H7258_10575 [Ferruginibacter sp.]|nr:hypothetical protein [Ferruginibacter sp.]